MYKNDYEKMEKQARQAVKMADAVARVAEMTGLGLASGLVGLLLSVGERIAYASNYFIFIVIMLAVSVLTRWVAELVAERQARQAELYRRLKYATPYRRA